MNNISGIQYRIKIDNPCQQRWNEMKPVGSGRYCTNCSKTVMDFSGLTDTQVIHKIQYANGKICGRLNRTQVDRTLVPLENKPIYSKFYKILAGLFVFVFSKPANAFPIELHENEIENFSSDPDTISPNEKHYLNSPVHNTSYPVIEGIIKDADSGEELIGAIIHVQSTDHHVFTDAEGKFELPIPDNFPNDTIFVEVTYIGYETYKFHVNKKHLISAVSERLTIELQPMVIIGEVCVIKEKRKKKAKRN